MPESDAQGPRVVAALAALFKDLSAAEREWQAGQERHVVDPTALREALGIMSSKLYKCGQ